MTDEHMQALLQEKATIIEELKSHAKADPQVRGMVAAVFVDQGNELDDNAHEVAETEVDVGVVQVLIDRLESINLELETLS